jgi:hypothetical protein
VARFGAAAVELGEVGGDILVIGGPPAELELPVAEIARAHRDGLARLL